LWNLNSKCGKINGTIIGKLYRGYANDQELIMGHVKPTNQVADYDFQEEKILKMQNQ
jgi:hypothetical protein